jgi:hypothetical protein
MKWVARHPEEILSIPILHPVPSKAITGSPIQREEESVGVFLDSVPRQTFIARRARNASKGIARMGVICGEGTVVRDPEPSTWSS